MFKKMFGLAAVTAVVAACAKVVKDILNADEEEKSIIDLDEHAGEHQENTTEE
ncbi:MAG: hypothetical protein Q4C64_07070 [Erysipelotrichia bacterium]|nr:hypothetical protein [Erysipelotrichia bacterium]